MVSRSAAETRARGLWAAAVLAGLSVMAAAAADRIDSATVASADPEARTFAIEKKGERVDVGLRDGARIIVQRRISLEEIEAGAPMTAIGEVSESDRRVIARQVVVLLGPSANRVTPNRVIGVAAPKGDGLEIRVGERTFAVGLNTNTDFLRTENGTFGDVRKGARLNVVGERDGKAFTARHVYVFAPPREKKEESKSGAAGRLPQAAGPAVLPRRGPGFGERIRKRVMGVYINWHPLSENQSRYPDRTILLSTGDPVADMVKEVEVARRHGIDAWEFEHAIRNYLGHMASYEDMLEATEGLDFDVFPEIWAQNFFRDPRRGETPASIETVLHTWLERYNDDPRVPRIAGRPVMLYWATGKVKPDTWREIARRARSSGYDPWHVAEIHLHWFGSDDPISPDEVIPLLNVFDGWWLFGGGPSLPRALRINREMGEIIRKNYGNTKIFAPSTAWGYWNPHSRTNYVCDNTRPFRERWEQCLELDADWIVLTTWNEFNESTYIVPTVNRSYTLLKLTEYYAKRWRGQPAILDEGAWNVSFRKELLMGETAKIEFITMPDGRHRDFHVACDLLDETGRVVKAFEPRRHAGDTIEVTTFSFDTAEAPLARALIPRFSIRRGAPDGPHILKPTTTAFIHLKKDQLTSWLCWHVTLDKAAPLSQFDARLGGRPMRGVIDATDEADADAMKDFSLALSADEKIQRVYLFKNHEVARVFGAPPATADAPDGMRRETIRLQITSDAPRWMVAAVAAKNGVITDSGASDAAPATSKDKRTDANAPLILTDSRTRSRRTITFEALVTPETTFHVDIGAPDRGVRPIVIQGERQPDEVADPRAQSGVAPVASIDFTCAELRKGPARRVLAEGFEAKADLVLGSISQQPPAIDARAYRTEARLPATDRDWPVDLYHATVLLEDGRQFYSPPCWVRKKADKGRTRQRVLSEAAMEPRAVEVRAEEIGYAEWRFEPTGADLPLEDSGTYGFDLEATEKDSTRPTPATEDGRSALRFDGKDDRLTLPLGTLPVGPFTVEAWVKPAASGPAVHLFGRRGTIQLYLTAAGNLAATRRVFDRDRRFTDHDVTSDQALEPGRWHHVAAVCDQASLALYLDGKPAGKTPCAGWNHCTPPGWIGSANGRQVFNGWLDDVRLTYRALTAEELSQRAGGK